MKQTVDFLFADITGTMEMDPVKTQAYLNIRLVL
jgi:hypothetical protein